MKSSLKMLRGFALHKRESKEKKDFQSPEQLDELTKAAEDMQEMRNCYDSLLSAAAATTNSAYEFSESLHEMGKCLLERTALNEDEECSEVLQMLGNVQFELQKLVDKYRSHIVQTISTPSESLLNELRTVEEMKRQCDEKRSMCEYMLTTQREKGRSRHTKGETVLSQQLKTAQEDYDQEATIFVFRLKSLKKGQSRSLLTQAARHHAAQLNFFRKGLKYLEAAEPHLKVVTEQQHIDYQISSHEAEESDDDNDDDEEDGYDANKDVELSFDYGKNDHVHDVVSTARNSMELDQAGPTFSPALAVDAMKENPTKIQGDQPVLSRMPKTGSQSAPLLPDKKFDPAEKIRDIHPSSNKKFHTYVLPTPHDAKSSVPSGSSYPLPGVRQGGGSGHADRWYSSPLEPKHEKDSREHLSADLTRTPKEHSVLKESNSATMRMSERLSLQQSDTASDPKKIKRHNFSGPLTSKAWMGKPSLTASGPIASTYPPQFVSNVYSRNRTNQSPSPPKVSPSTSPPLFTSPKISELHELPRPPVNLVGHSAPLIARSPELSVTNKVPLIISHTASPLPTPPGAVTRSYSIPSSSRRAMTLGLNKLIEARHSEISEDSSPPLTPISLKNNLPVSTASDAAVLAGSTRD